MATHRLHRNRRRVTTCRGGRSAEIRDAIHMSLEAVR